MRVHELAKELGTTSEELLKLCKQLGMKAANRLSGLSAEEAASLRQKLPAGAKKVAGRARSAEAAAKHHRPEDAARAPETSTGPAAAKAALRRPRRRRLRPN